MASTSPFPSPYVSPYEVSGVNPDYVTDLAAREASYLSGVTSPGGNPTVSPVVADWYTNSASVWGNPGNASYGAAPLVLPQPTVPSGLTAAQTIAFYRQRLVQAASDYIGTPYQHHHLPAWNPFAPANGGFTSVPPPSRYPMLHDQWAWQAVSTNQPSQQFGPTLVNGIWQMSEAQFDNQYASTYGVGGPGIDCSDLTTLVYSLAAGIYMNSAVIEQGVADGNGAYSGSSPIGWSTSAVPIFVDPALRTDPNISPIVPQFLFGPNSVYLPASNQRGIATWNRPGSLDYVESQLQPGDLLYIAASNAPPNNAVSHVVMWLGVYGTTTDPVTGTVTQVPLVVSSHDNTPAVLDANAQLPPLYGSPGAGNMPPPGVHILPFAQNNWFYSNFSHAMRLLPSGNGQASSAGAVSFGSQLLGTTSAASNAVITNSGSAPVAIPGQVTLTGSGAGQFSVASGDNCSGTTLAAGASCQVPLTFTPSAGGPTSASLVVPVATFAATAPAAVTVPLSGTGMQSQSIAFTPPATTPLTAGTVALSATASSGLPVSYQSLTTEICTVSGSTATVKATGLCGVTASQAGNASFAAAPAVSVSFSVTGSASSPGQTAVAGIPDNPPAPRVVAPGALLVGQRVAESTDPRFMRNAPADRPGDAPVLSARPAAPVALVTPGLAAGVRYSVRLRINGGTADLGVAQAGTDGSARLPVFALTRPGTYVLVLVNEVTNRRSYVTVQVEGRRPAR